MRTNSHTPLTTRSLTLAAGAIIVASSVCLAQPDRERGPDRRSDRPQQRDDRRPPAGPDAGDRDQPGGPRDKDGAEGRRRDADHVGPRMLVRAVRQLNTPETDESLNTTEEQTEQIRTLMESFGQDVRDYRDEHKDEVQKLRQTLREARKERRGARDDNDEANGDDAPSKDVTDARSRMREILEGAPQFKDTLDDVMAVLDEDQQSFVKERMAEHRERMHEQRRDHQDGEGRPERPRRDRDDMDNDDDHRDGERAERPRRNRDGGERPRRGRDRD